MTSAPRARFLLALLAVLGGLAADPAGTRGQEPARAPSRELVVLSTTDLKGKTGPCGCHVPKGGLARIAGYADSIRAVNPNVLTVTNAGFFPETPGYEDAAAFLMDALETMGTDAIGVSEKELLFGRAFLLANYKRSGAPLVCANLYDRASGQTLVAPYVVRKVGPVTVGIFGLTSDKADLGLAKDSCTVSDPAAAATRTVEALRRKGATVIVLLSELGKVDSEDLVTSVEGIDVLVCGRNAPLLQKGRTIRNTVACYGGEQGQYIGRSTLSLDEKNRMTTGENVVDMLGPEVASKTSMLALVKGFEDRFNDKLRQREKERAVQAEQARLNGGATTEQAVDHYIGAEFCQRCHANEFDQWKSSPHARAWGTLVDAKQETKPECVGCHVTAYRQVGGFQGRDDATRMGAVQCETCHGMGTQHESYPSKERRITAATCQACHTAKDSPNFDFDRYLPYVNHAHASGDLAPLSQGSPMKRAH